jgi:putative oxidoreductase
MKDTTDLIARIFISLIFLFEAYDSIFHFKEVKSIMTGYGVTWQQDFLLGVAIFLLVLGGILVLIGYRPGFGASLLLIYWIPLTFITHTWWNDPDITQRQESVDFMKNIAIIGALLLIVINGSGRFSVRRLFATTIVKR